MKVNAVWLLLLTANIAWGKFCCNTAVVSVINYSKTVRQQVAIAVSWLAMYIDERHTNTIGKPTASLQLMAKYTIVHKILRVQDPTFICWSAC